MRSMIGVLKEELIRLKEAEKSCLREIKKLARGSLQVKKIKGIGYLYLVSSKNSKISYRYVGRLPESELEKLKEEIALRKKYQNLLKEVRNNIKRIARIVYGKRRAV